MYTPEAGPVGFYYHDSILRISRWMFYYPESKTVTDQWPESHRWVRVGDMWQNTLTKEYIAPDSMAPHPDFHDMIVADANNIMWELAKMHYAPREHELGMHQ